MIITAGRKKIFLNPGDIYFGSGDLIIETVLGSCIAIYIWNQKNKFGGLCHYVVPDIIKNNSEKKGYSGIEAIDYYNREILKLNMSKEDFIYKVFGGSCISSNNEECKELEIGNQNSLYAENYLKKNKLKTTAIDIGGAYSRKIIMDLSNGEIWLRKTLIGRSNKNDEN